MGDSIGVAAETEPDKNVIEARTVGGESTSLSGFNAVYFSDVDVFNVTEEHSDDVRDNDLVDYKDESSFSKHMKGNRPIHLSFSSFIQ